LASHSNVILAAKMPDNTGASDSSALTLAASSAAADSCLAHTTIGAIEGFIDPQFPHVRQWLGIPFAEPPVGPLRFALPEPKAPFANEGVFAANKMPLAPMQAITTKPDVYAKHVPEFLATGPYSEDCLYLNIFAPIDKPAPSEKAKEPLPTIVFFYGGEGEWGGINAEYSQPQQWVESSQNHIVVLFKWVPFRLTCLPLFPNSGLGFLSFLRMHANKSLSAGE